jgi:hypothetical protein
MRAPTHRQSSIRLTMQHDKFCQWRLVPRDHFDMQQVATNIAQTGQQNMPMRSDFRG